VICTQEANTKDRPEWTQKVVDAITRGASYASQNKEQVAKLLSREGAAYLPAPADVVVKSVVDYGPHYEKEGAIHHRHWQNGRIDFQPWPYPSATRLIVEAMNKTVVEGDTTFLKNLDPNFVADDLVDYRFIKSALERYPDWKNDPSIDKANPYERKEVLELS
jgi:NitT/TauT family transport system substrate-binding protein